MIEDKFPTYDLFLKWKDKLEDTFFNNIYDHNVKKAIKNNYSLTQVAIKSTDDYIYLNSYCKKLLNNQVPPIPYEEQDIVDKINICVPYSYN